MSEIKIRYNTNAKPDDTLHWRALINGVEHLASNVKILKECETTKDWIEGVGMKWHITIRNGMWEWNENEITIF